MKRESNHTYETPVCKNCGKKMILSPFNEWICPDCNDVPQKEKKLPNLPWKEKEDDKKPNEPEFL